MVRFGFGEKTETTDHGTQKYENGHVEVSRKAFDYAIQENETLPPLAALGVMCVREAQSEERAGEVLAALVDAEDDAEDD